MSTRSIVPRADNEGGIGVTAKKWASVWAYLINALTLTAQSVGFTISGGTTSKTLTVLLDASVSGTNTGDGATLPAVVLIDGATPALDVSLGVLFTLDAAGDRTIAIPTNAVSGKKIIIRHYANGGARTLSLNTGANGFSFGSDITALTATASGKYDYIGCIWNDTSSKWNVVSVVKGF